MPPIPLKPFRNDAQPARASVKIHSGRSRIARGAKSQFSPSESGFFLIDEFNCSAIHILQIEAEEFQRTGYCTSLPLFWSRTISILK
jgi:hypothetical protein